MPRSAQSDFKRQSRPSLEGGQILTCEDGREDDCEDDCEDDYEDDREDDREDDHDWIDLQGLQAYISSDLRSRGPTLHHKRRYLADVSKMPSNNSELTASAGGGGPAVTETKRKRKANSQSASRASCGGSAAETELPSITERAKSMKNRGAKTTGK